MVLLCTGTNSTGLGSDRIVGAKVSWNEDEPKELYILRMKGFYQIKRLRYLLENALRACKIGVHVKSKMQNDQKIFRADPGERLVTR